MSEKNVTTTPKFSGGIFFSLFFPISVFFIYIVANLANLTTKFKFKTLANRNRNIEKYKWIGDAECENTFVQNKIGIHQNFPNESQNNRLILLL